MAEQRGLNCRRSMLKHTADLSLVAAGPFNHDLKKLWETVDELEGAQ